MSQPAPHHDRFVRSPLPSRGRVLSALALAALAVVLAAGQAAQPPAPVRTPAPGADAARAVLGRHCAECHGPAVQKAEFRVDTLPADLTDPAAQKAWRAVLDRVSDGSMPPPRKPRLPKGDLDALAGWARAGLAAADRDRQQKEGRVVLRRLNRSEYENTVRDLLGVRVDLREALPPDPVSHGFDNVAADLNLSPVHLQRYLEAADAALAAAVTHEAKPEPLKKTYTYADKAFEGNLGKSWHKLPDGAVVLPNEGLFPSTALSPFRAPASGRYTVRITGYGYKTRGPVNFIVYSTAPFRNGGADVEGFIELPADKAATVELTTWLDARDSLRLSPQGLPRATGKVDLADRPGLAVVGVEVDGPHLDAWPPRGHALLFGDLPSKPVAGAKPQPKGKAPPATEVVSADPDKDARRLLPGFVSAAFRRPVTGDQVAPYLAVFAAERKAGASFEEAMRAAAAAVLCAPDFLFLREAPGRLDDHALAARLSYFLHRSMPDDGLLKLAAAKKLSDPAVLRAETERLLKHPHAERFVADFTDAWLNLRDIDATTPDRQLYPEYDTALEHAMVRETRSFFAEVLNQNLPAATFLDSDFAMLNARLARHYGVPGVAGPEVRRVKLPPDSGRGGLLTQAAVLKVSANGTSTSPVVRGVYVLERFMGVTPPPPPPVPAIEPDIRGAKTIREILDKHRTGETCAGCHRQIDPPGFALEEFDPIGGHRDRFRSLGVGTAPKAAGVRYKVGLPVDASGELPGGKRFKNFAEFRKLLAADPDRFAACLAGKLVTFATGRAPGPGDQAEVDALVRASAAKKHAFRDLVHAVVQSELFRTK